MHARGVAVPVDPNKLEEMLQIWQDSVMPAAKSQQGFQGNLLLGDRTTGSVMSISLWDSEADMMAGEQSGYYQDQVAKLSSMFTAQPDMKHYEVLFQV